ncbi:hypothetical protein CSKR_108326 [Clonorchis sinensis]|uniref:Uncharacterized protein n=1 Tax=Clonorchis sinensis TaxID=79923 RepID=A0A419PCK5_CLOSI|nr:hypothetical protein CSKR_108326 [Clonorchis sinensis]
MGWHRLQTITYSIISLLIPGYEIFYRSKLYVLGHSVCANKRPVTSQESELAQLGQSGSIPALVLRSGGMPAGHRKGVTAERLFIYLLFTSQDTRYHEQYDIRMNFLGTADRNDKILAYLKDWNVQAARQMMLEQQITYDAEARNGVWLKGLEHEFTDRKVRGSNPNSASRLPLSRLGQPGSIPALVLPSGSMAARHRKGVTAER